MKLFNILLLSALLLASCKQNADEASSDDTSTSAAEGQKTMEEQILAIHDEMMPKMKDINDLESKLRAIKSNIREDATGKIEYPSGLESVMDGLKLAEQGMWDWMKAYSDAKATLKEDQKDAFYQSQMDLILKVKSDMTTAMEKAQAWLADNTSQQ